MISVVLIVIDVESLLHTKLEPPFISPLSTNTNAPFTSLPSSKSVVRVQEPDAHKYIPFCDNVVWSFTNTRSPTITLIPSIICVEDNVILAVVATATESLNTRPVTIPST